MLSPPVRILAIIADYAIRLVAIAGLFSPLPMLLLPSIMAGPIGVLILAVLAIGAMALAGLILFSNKKYVRAAAYAIAVIAFVATIKSYRDAREYRKNSSPVLLVPASDPAYPHALNPWPQWSIRVFGALPASVRLEGFIAHYTTKEGDSDLQHRNVVCTRTQVSPYSSTSVMSLRYDEIIKPQIANGQYEVVFVVDKFLDTPCAWRLRSVDFTIAGSPYPSPVIDLLYGNDHFGFSGAPENPARLDLWCYERPMQHQAPFHPITGCASFPGNGPGPHVIFKVPLESLIPASQRPLYWRVLLHAPKSSLVLDFHDYDKFVKENQLEPSAH